ARPWRRPAPQTPPVDCRQTEGAQAPVRAAGPRAQLLEDRHAVVVAGDRLVVDQAGAATQLLPQPQLLSAVLSSCHWKKLRAAPSEPIYRESNPFVHGRVGSPQPVTHAGKRV